VTKYYEFPWGTDYLAVVQLGDGPNAIDVPVYQHHYDTARENLPEGTDEKRVHAVACRLAVVEYDERETV